MLHVAVAPAAELCTRWSEAVKVGQLDVKIINEASGMAISHRTQRLYHINDGEFPFFHVTDLQGGSTQTVRLTGFVPQDVEDIALGPCGRDACLYIADIGDNAFRRESVKIAVVQESDQFGDQVAPVREITGRYPDGAHDAEALALHPSGDLYIVTKSRIGQQQNPSQLFRLKADTLARGGDQTFELMGTIPVSRLTEPLGDSPRRIVTSMDISADGKKIILLTYDAAIEFAVDLARGLPAEWVEGKTHRAFPVASLIQTEAIAWERDGRAVLYSTESVRGSAAPLMRQACLDPDRAP